MQDGAVNGRQREEEAGVTGDIKHMSISDDFLSKQAQAPRSVTGLGLVAK